MSAASLNLECRFVLKNKSNCARRMSTKYDGLCKHHFDKLSEKEQEQALTNGHLLMVAQMAERKAAKAKAKLAETNKTVIIESESAILENFNYEKTKWEEERLTIHEATKKVLEDHSQLVQLTENQAKEIEELKAQLAMARELTRAQQQNIDSHLKIRDVIKGEIERANRR